MVFHLLPAQMLRRPTSVWGRVDANHPGEGAGYEGILAALLLLVAGGLLVCLLVWYQKWRLAARAEPPEGYEEYERLEHAADQAIRLLFVTSQIAVPLGACGAFVLGEGYELFGLSLPTLVLGCSLLALTFAILAWVHIGRLRGWLVLWRRGLQLSGGE